MRVFLVVGILVLFATTWNLVREHPIQKFRAEFGLAASGRLDVQRDVHDQGWWPLPVDKFSDKLSPRLEWSARADADTGYSFPCNTHETPEWMIMPNETLACYARPLFGPRDLADEFGVLCLANMNTPNFKWVIGHFDRQWPTGTWEGHLIPEDYGEKSWCGFPL